MRTPYMFVKVDEGETLELGGRCPVNHKETGRA